MICPRCYFVVTLVQMVQIICIIPIFGVIFCCKKGYLTLLCDHIYRVTPYQLAINFEEIPSCFVLDIFLWALCTIKWPKFGSCLHNNNIWAHFWSKSGYLTFRVTIYKVTRYCFITLCPRCILCGYISLSNGRNWKVICIIPIIGVIYW